MSEHTVNPNPVARGKFDSIQACRFVAAVMILWVHFRYVIGIETSEAWWVQTGMGGFGVDLFFVISGFVMVICTKNRNLTRYQFLKSRFIRIIPFYLICSFPYIAKDILEGRWVRLFNSFAFFPIFDVKYYGGTSHPLGWTIAFEIWFYLLFCVILLNKYGGQLIKGLMITGALALVGGFFYKDSWFLPRFLFCPLVLEFLSGCLIAEIYPRIGKKTAIACLMAAMVLYFGVVARYGELTWYGSVIISFKLSLLKFCVWGVPAALFCLSIVSLEKLNILRTPKILVSLGETSFSLYMIQPFLVLFCQKYLIFQSIYVTAAIYFITSITIAFIISRYLEYPLLKVSRKLFAKRRGLVVRSA